MAHKHKKATIPVSAPIAPHAAPINHAALLKQYAHEEKQSAKRAELFLAKCARAITDREKSDAKVMGAGRSAPVQSDKSEKRRIAIPHYELKGIRTSMPLPKALICNRPDLRLDGINRRPVLIGGSIRREYTYKRNGQVKGYTDIMEPTAWGASTQSDSNYDGLTLVKTRKGTIKLSGKSAPRSQSSKEMKPSNGGLSQKILIPAPSDATLELAAKRAIARTVNNSAQSNHVVAMNARSEYLVTLLIAFRGRIGADMGASQRASIAMGLLQRYRKEKSRA